MTNICSLQILANCKMIININNMKFKILFTTLLALSLFSSCIKDEPLNKEADIESFSLPDSILINSVISDNKVTLVIKGTDYKKLAPQIVVTPGATITPASGDTLDFTNGVTYTVVSEDKKYSKIYTVSVTSSISLKFDFEDWFMEGSLWKYPALDDDMWSSANQGIMMAKLGKVDVYPTRSTEDAFSGKHAALLETQRGGTFLVAGYVPIFSGSLFRGAFKLNMASPPKSALFGQIHPKENGKPIHMTGYYKYAPGDTLINRNGIVPNKVDELSIYAVVYKVTKGSEGLNEYLNGENVLTSDKLVGKAILEDRSPKDKYTKFDLPFVYTEELNYDLYDYKLAVVFASSKNGDFYEGAVGSKLIVDNVEVVCEYELN